MTLRAGSYNARKPEWHGVVRDNGYPWYICTHKNHQIPFEAAQCAKIVLPKLKARDHSNPEAPLPDGWEVFNPDRRYA